MEIDSLETVKKLFIAHQKAEVAELEARNHFYSAIREAVKNGPRGTQAEIVDLTKLTRERIRQIVKPYRRTIVRFTAGGGALITLLSSKDIHSDADYEIRTKPDEGDAILGTVKGWELLNAREEQLAAYLAEDPERRTNIRMVDVSRLVDVSDYV